MKYKNWLTGEIVNFHGFEHVEKADGEVREVAIFTKANGTKKQRLKYVFTQTHYAI